MALDNAYTTAPGIGEEMGPIITALKEGNVMTRYYSNKKRNPDSKIFMLKLEEFQLEWYRTGKEGGRLEGTGATEVQQHCYMVVLWLILL